MLLIDRRLREMGAMFMFFWIVPRRLWMRWSRRRHGLCTKCKYQLAGLTTCPECGTATHKHRHESAVSTS